MANVVITGANRGIGLELARQRADRDRVIAVCRRPSEELAALDVQIEAGVDVTDDTSVAQLAGRIGSIDVLINNAGILRADGIAALDAQGIREQFEVNALGPLRVTSALASKLGRGGKVAIVTSRMGSIADNTSGGMYGYRMSKAAVNMAGASLAHDLRPRGIAVVLLHPGYVQTEMTGGHGNVTAEQSARQLWARIDELTLETTGRFVHASGEALPW